MRTWWRCRKSAEKNGYNAPSACSKKWGWQTGHTTTRENCLATSEAFESYRYYSASDETRKERLEALNEAQNRYDHAVKRLKLDYELQVAQANLDKAREDCDIYTAGPSPDDLALAEAELANAQAQLTLAQDDLEKAIED